MPIKVKCKCGQAFAAKDQMAGKVVKCPKCSKPIRIPQPKATSAARGPAAPAPIHSGLEELLDEVGLKARQDGYTGRRCPSCDAPLAHNAILCVECGYNLQTGKFIEGLVPATSQKSGPVKAEGHEGAAEMLLEKAEAALQQDAQEEKKMRTQGMPAWLIAVWLAVIVSLMVAATVLGGGVAFGLLIVMVMLIGIALVGTAVGALLFALVFRLTCLIYNKLAGGFDAPGAVPEPTYGKAYKIVFKASVMSAVVNFALGFLIGVAIVLVKGAEAADEVVNSANTKAILNSLGTPIALFIWGNVIRTMLPTKFGRALLLTLLYLVLAIVAATIVFGPIVGILMMLSVIG